MTTTNKLLEQPAAGSLNWDVPLNANAGYIDAALGSSATITDTIGIVTLAASQFRCMALKSTTLPFTGNVTYVIPSGVGGQWIVKNQSDPDGDEFNLIIKNAANSTSVTIANGQTRTVWSDGVKVYLADDIDIATQAQAEAGTNNTALMTPLRVEQAITSDIATQAQATDLTPANTGLMTPYRTQQSIYANAATLAQVQTASPGSTGVMTPLRTKDSITYNVTTTFVQGKISDGSRGAVGTYAFAGTNNHSGVTGGETTAGSNLRYASLWRTTTNFGTYYVVDFGTSPLSGTWRLMGETFLSTQDSQTGLFLRTE
jgi:hypothetical protein